MRNLALVMIAAALPLLASADSLSLPFERDEKLGVLRVEAKVNGVDTVLLVDTGASRSIIGADLAGIPRPLLPPKLARPAPGVRITGLSGRASLCLGSRAWSDWPFVVTDMGAFRLVYGASVGGIIGQDLLDQFDSVEIDNRHHRIVLRD